MAATIINAIAIIVGSLIGLFAKKAFSEKTEETVFNACGFVTLVIGMQMALKSGHILALAIAVIGGGIIGTAIGIENGVLKLGEALKRRFAGKEEGSTFAFGFLNASVLFCSGAMAIVGSFKAGTEGDFSILYTKSVLDFFISVMFTGAMGIGVAFSALSVLVYQGLLTAVSVWIKPWVTELMLAELTGVGGLLLLMISVNLLKLKNVRTGDFLPAILIMAGLVMLFPRFPFL
ncbi:MAG: DUF554 domain-containing protein [Spirochaetes bacterium]|nr:DUF554 domain-containing protein [Spirochaetota bacterium]